MEGNDRWPIPGDWDLGWEVSPAETHLGDALFLNKMLLWNHFHLAGKHRLLPGEYRSFPAPPHLDPDG